MRTLTLFLPLMAACTAMPTGEVPVGTGFPESYRGTWAPDGACAAPIRIDERTLGGQGNLCTLVRATPAAGGGLLAEMTCTAGEEARSELARLTLRRETLAYRSAGGRADWRRCS